MSIHDWVFGFGESEITKLLKDQQSFWKKLQEMSEGFAGFSEKVTGLEGALSSTQKTVSGLSGEVTKLSENFTDLSKDVMELSEKFTTAIGESDKTIAMCVIASSIAVATITCFIAFCIYQGVKCEKEKKMNSSSTNKGIPSTDLNTSIPDNAKQPLLDLSRKVFRNVA